MRAVSPTVSRPTRDVLGGRRRETRLGGLEKQNEKLKGQLADMRRVAYIEDRIKRQGLGLAQPLPGQIWRLTEPPRDRREAGTPEVDAQVALQETKGLP